MKMDGIAKELAREFFLKIDETTFERYINKILGISLEQFKKDYNDKKGNTYETFLYDLTMNNKIIVNKHATIVFLPNGKRKRLSDGNIDLADIWSSIFYSGKMEIEGSLLCIDEVRAMIQTEFHPNEIRRLDATLDKISQNTEMILELLKKKNKFFFSGSVEFSVQNIFAQ
ncbi:hypothetical protein C2G38_369583 [Gigaspora rosea]|uniref:Uncharacterized protein n=1 Tax=Gigaspora rosea TaxID=44941 RepID=A0A397UG52_9GLOM|nr:hypothetical protein C2G38_369583 [Gigaspora rosea]